MGHLVEPGDPVVERLAAVEQDLQPARQRMDVPGTGLGADLVAAEPALRRIRLGGVDLAGMNRPLHQQPGHHLHQPGGEPHGLAAGDQPHRGRQLILAGALTFRQVGARLDEEVEGLVKGAVEERDRGGAVLHA